VSRTYDKNFWVISQTVGGGSTVSFGHDTDGLVTKAGVLTVRRSLQHRLITGTTLGVSTDTRTYNGFGELTSYTASVNGAAVYKNQLTRNADGMITARTETIGGVANAYSYSYDLARRLTGAAKNGAVDSYTYDTNSNRLSATNTSGTANGTYDAEDRLLTYGSASFTYTASGDTSSQKIGAQKTTYTYDALGNLTATTLPNGTKITYVIDAKNRRVGKTVNGVLISGFLYDKTSIVAQLNGNNQLVSQFVYATGSASPDYMISGGATYRIISDVLGSPVLVIDTASGAIVEQISYDEFGNVLTDTNPGFQPFGFAGGLYDQDTKLVRFGARDYNPTIGRWTAKDPSLFSGGDPNLYGYVLNDPVNSTDPSGLGFSDWWWVKWITSLFEEKKCETCEVPPDKPEKEPEGNGITTKEVAKDTAVDVGVEAGSEAVGEAVESQAIGKVLGPTMTVVKGAEVGAEGILTVVKAGRDQNNKIDENDRICNQ
jgi:RHS repeat-associated protein